MKNKIVKPFDAVKFMREQRYILSQKISTLSKEDIVKYFELRKSQQNIKPCS